MEIQQQKHTTSATGAKVKRVINELEANFNSIREKESTSVVAVNASHFHQRKEQPVQHSVHQQTTIPLKTSWTTSTPVTTQVHATQTSVAESPRILSFKTIPVPSIPKAAMNMDSDSSFHGKPIVPLTTVSVSTCPSCGSENVSSTSNGARRSASFQHLTTSKVNCNGHNRCDPYSNPRHHSSSKLLPSMNNVHRSRSFNCNLATSVPNMEPDASSNSCDCHCKCLVCRGRQTKRQTPNRYTSHYQHLNHHQYQPITNYRRHKQGKKRKQPSFRHSSVYPLTLDPISLEKQWNSYCCQGCVSSGSNTTTSNLIHPRCTGGQGMSSYFPLPRKSSSYQLHHDDSILNPISNHRTWKAEKRLNSSGIYRDYRYWDVDEWRAQLKKERAKRKERAALMAVSALGIIIFICVSYFGTLLFLRITKLP